MIGALWILAVLVVTGVALYIFDRPRRRHRNDPPLPAVRPEGARASDDSQCCGMHLVCEKSLPYSEKPVYFDDEELDRFAGRDPLSFTDEEVEEFRDVMLTLLPADRLPWAQSVTRRHIPLPPVISQELSLLLSEQ